MEPSRLRGAGPGPSALVGPDRGRHARGMASRPGEARIVVGVDGSPASKHALHWAADEAIYQGVGLDIIHASGSHHSMFPDGGHIHPAPFERAARAILDDAVAALAQRGVSPPDVRPVLAEDDAATALLTAAGDAALLVVGSRGHGGFVGLLLGSVSQRCVDHAKCPVAVIPPSWDGATHGRIVVGVDGSEASYGALHWAIAEAARRDAQLDVVNAYGFHQYPSPYGPTVAIDPDQLETGSKALLDKMVAGAFEGPGPPRAVETIATSMTAVPALLESAKGADLLVVGSRGRGSFTGLLLGSVSQQCVHHAPCPVVVVHPPRPEQSRAET
jgi:nucleotide-binding universal stress UspA family protein